MQLAVAAKRPAADAGLGPGGLFVEILNHYLYFFDQVIARSVSISSVGWCALRQAWGRPLRAGRS